MRGVMAVGANQRSWKRRRMHYAQLGSARLRVRRAPRRNWGKKDVSMKMQRCEDSRGVMVPCAGEGHEGHRMVPLSECWADLDGEPFRAYYCHSCTSRMLIAAARAMDIVTAVKAAAIALRAAASDGDPNLVDKVSGRAEELADRAAAELDQFIACNQAAQEQADELASALDDLLLILSRR